jgi:hypothetical protein
MHHARTYAGLCTGLLLLDLLLNCAGFSPSAPVGSLLLPSIDLLVAAAAFLGIAQAGTEGRRFLLALVCTLVVALAVYRAGTRFGFAVGLRAFGGAGWALVAGWVLTILCCAAGLAIAWVAGRLVVNGFASGITRSVFLLVVAVLAVVHVLSGNHVFLPSIIPRIVRDIAAAFR